MKKKVILLFLVFIFSFVFVNASCELDAVLLNQDPYPVSPNSYVEIVFQVNGVDNSECYGAIFELIPSFPFTIVEGETKRILDQSTYVKNYKTGWMIPYKLKVDADVLDGFHEVEVKYSPGDSNNSVKKRFEIKVEDVIADFELHVKDYSYETDEFTIEILNIADVDVEALTLEIPKQENIEIRGSNRIVVGDLDSNEYTSADFESTVVDGEIKIDIFYTDEVGERRSLEKIVVFDSSYFEKRNGDESSVSGWLYVLVLVVIILIIWWIFRQRKKKKQRSLHRRGMAKL